MKAVTIEGEPMPTQREFYSLDEVRRAMDDIAQSPATMLKLHQISRAYAWRSGLSHDAAGDLLNEAFARSAEGQRAWPKNLAPTSVLIGIIRSVASIDKRTTKRVVSMTTDDGGDSEIGADGRPSPEQVVIYAQFTDRLIELLPPGGIDRDMLKLLLAGADAAEVQIELGISKTTYASSLTAIRRARAKLLSQDD